MIKSRFQRPWAAAMLATIIFAIVSVTWWWFEPATQFYTEPIQRWQASNSDVVSLEFGKNGEKLVSLSDNGEVRIWRILDGQRVDVPVMHATNVKLICVTKDGEYLATSDADGIINVITLADEKEVMAISDFKKSAVDALFWSPTSRLLAAYSGSGERLVIWDINKRIKKCEIRIPAGVGRCFAFSPDSALVLTGVSMQDFIDAWDIERGEKAAKYQGDTANETRRFSAIRCDNASRHFLTSTWSGNVVEWNIDLPNPLRVMKAHRIGLAFNCIEVARDDSLMITSQHNGTYLMPSHVRIWNRKSWELLKEIKTPRPLSREQTKHNVKSLAIDPEGEVVAVGYTGGTISLWSLRKLHIAK